MALTDHDSVVKFGAPWYRDRYLAQERHQRIQDTLAVIAGVLLLSIPVLVVSIGYLAWRLWHRTCGT